MKAQKKIGKNKGKEQQGPEYGKMEKNGSYGWRGVYTVIINPIC